MFGKLKDLLLGSVTCECGSRKKPEEVSRKAPMRIKVSSHEEWTGGVIQGSGGFPVMHNQVKVILTSLGQFKCPDCGRMAWREIEQEVTEFEGNLTGDP